MNQPKIHHPSCPARTPLVPAVACICPPHLDDVCPCLACRARRRVALLLARATRWLR